MRLLETLVIGAQSGQQGQQQSSGQGGDSGPGLMSLLSKATKSGHSAVVSGARALVSAYRSRKTNRQRAMKHAMTGLALMGFGVWQLRRKSKSGGQGSGGHQQPQGIQQAVK